MLRKVLFITWIVIMGFAFLLGLFKDPRPKVDEKHDDNFYFGVKGISIIFNGIELAMLIWAYTQIF